MEHFSYNTQDPLTLHLTALGYHPKPDYWMDTDVVVGMQIELNGAIVRYHWEAPTLIIQHYEILSPFKGLKNPFCGFFELIRILLESDLPITHLAGKPHALMHSRLEHDRLWRFYLKMGVRLIPEWSGWVFLELPKSTHNTLFTPRLLSKAMRS